VNHLFAFDLQEVAGQGLRACVAGADEAGRGALAGPLVAAAVCFDYTAWADADFDALDGLNDSKQLCRERREELLADIVPRAAQLAVVTRAPASIDQRGLHVCNMEALAAALRALVPPPAVALVDGFALSLCTVPHRAVVGGDGRSAAVASILAKVTRDRLMCALHADYPQWGFEEHVGYATPGHHAAILRHGICALHRRSFNSVAYQQLELTWMSEQAGVPPGRDG